MMGSPETVRVRFAPSPTGFLHVGGARTALFNWLFARRYGGTFILRVEDTDTARERPEFREEIFRALAWLGIEEDEGPTKGGPCGPYAQSERGYLYRDALERLEREGAVYPCFCGSLPHETGETESNAESEAVYAQPRCRCQALEPGDVAQRRAVLGMPPALRLRVDQEVTHRVVDLIRGEVSFPPGEVEDFIIAKAGGAPLYNFAAVVDDAAMRITHVIRGEEHLANTPKQLLLYRALGYAPPQFAHLPIILNAERKKLSKRDGATAVSDYERAGYFPDALRNFLGLLGWSPGGDRELLTLDEMIALFDLDRVQRHGAVFDTVKLTWMNGEYLRKTPPAQLARMTTALLARRPDAAELRCDPAHVTAVCALLQERAKTLAEIAGQTYFFSRKTKLEWDEEAVAKRAGTPQARERLAEVLEVFAESPAFDRVILEERLRAYAAQTQIKPGEYIAPLRVAITGAAVSPGIFEVCEVLGREIVLDRIAAFLTTHPLEVAS